MVTILVLLDKPPGFGFRCMDEQAPALGACGNVDAMKHFSRNKIETPGAQPAAVQGVAGEGVEHTRFLVGTTQHQ